MRLASSVVRDSASAMASCACSSRCDTGTGLGTSLACRASFVVVVGSTTRGEGRVLVCSAVNRTGYPLTLARGGTCDRAAGPGFFKVELSRLLSPPKRRPREVPRADAAKPPVLLPSWRPNPHVAVVVRAALSYIAMR